MPESSQADHSDQAIQPPKHRRRNTNQHKPRQPRGPWKPARPPKLSPPAAYQTSWASQTAPMHPKKKLKKSVCDVNRIGRVNPWRVCLVHSGDFCLLSQALVPFPHSERASGKQRLLPKRKENSPNSLPLPLNRALAALFHPAFKSAGVEAAHANPNEKAC